MIINDCNVFNKYDDFKTFKNVKAVFPNICPRCNQGIMPVLIYAVFINEDQVGFSALFLCPSCERQFLTHFIMISRNQYRYINVEPQSPIEKVFDENLSKISISFIEIYNQAYAAEAYSLNHIAGMGYRKALEFLIKDYILYVDPLKEEEIKNTKLQLKDLIEKYIDNQNIKDTAKASIWLGNDETHYVRKHNFDIEDLKKFIDCCVSWILMCYYTSKASTLVNKK